MNMYANPEKFGLKLIGMVDRSDGNYRFDIFVVWKKGRSLFYGTDSGCSCPQEFEDKGVDDLTQGRKAEVIRALKKWAAPVDKDHEESHTRREQEHTDASVVELCLKIRAA